MFHSIRWRITLPFALLSMGTALALMLILSSYFRQTYLENLEAKLASQARLIADALTPGLQARESGMELDAAAHRWAEILEARVTLIGPDGTVLGESHEDRGQMENHASRPEVADALVMGQGMSTRFSHTVGYEMMYTAVPILQDSELLGVVRVAVPLREVAAQVGQIQQILAAATLVVIALSVLLSGLISAPGCKPDGF
jgi:two-component system, OmpR family, phosphate regulon sensor histidine kinase PhoR